MSEETGQATQSFKRHVAYKLRVGQVGTGIPVIEDDRLKAINILGNRVTRVNLIANIVDKFIQDGEKKFGSLTLDDASGQIKAKVFGDELAKFEGLEQGDTVMVIGLLRQWNEEVYLTPEIIRKKDPAFLLVRKLEVEAEVPKQIDREKAAELKDKILEMVKGAEENGGIAIETIGTDLKEMPEIINGEVKKLLEDGIVYEPRPGKLRYLG